MLRCETKPFANQRPERNARKGHVCVMRILEQIKIRSLQYVCRRTIAVLHCIRYEAKFIQL